MQRIFKKFHRFLPVSSNVQFRQKTIYKCFCIKALDSFIFKKYQLDACKKDILRILKKENEAAVLRGFSFCTINKKASVIVSLNTSFMMTRKPKEVRMGKGKGAPSFAYFPVKRGRIIFELNNVSFSIAKSCMLSISQKLATRLRLLNLSY